MSDDNNTLKSGENDGSLAGDALLHAVRRDMQGVYGLVKALDQKVEAVDAKVEARLRDTTPMWEVVVSRLDTVLAGQENHQSRLDAIETEERKQGARLDAIEAELPKEVATLDAIETELRKQGTRLDAIETEQRKEGARLDAIERRLDAIELKLERFDAIDTELRHLRRRIERTIGQLSKDVVEYRVDQHDLEDRLEKLEKTPA